MASLWLELRLAEQPFTGGFPRQCSPPSYRLGRSATSCAPQSRGPGGKVVPVVTARGGRRGWSHRFICRRGESGAATLDIINKSGLPSDLPARKESEHA